jgi:hypothetical protein
MIQGPIDWGSPRSGFLDVDEWEKEPPPVRERSAPSSAATSPALPSVARHWGCLSRGGQQSCQGVAADVHMGVSPEYGYAEKNPADYHSRMQQLLLDVSPQPFPKLLNDTVLAPTGMTRSTYEQPLPVELRSGAATPYGADGQAPTPDRSKTPATGSWLERG